MEEKFDLFDRNGKPLGRTCGRGEELPDGSYRVVAIAWIYSRRMDKFLISRRSPNKSFPLEWEATKGVVAAGETSLDGALREAREEVGITLDSVCGKLVNTLVDDSKKALFDSWLFEYDGDEPITIQDDEVCEAKWATFDEIKAKYDNGEFSRTAFCRKVFEELGKI